MKKLFNGYLIPVLIIMLMSAAMPLLAQQDDKEKKKKGKQKNLFMARFERVVLHSTTRL